MFSKRLNYPGSLAGVAALALMSLAPGASAIDHGHFDWRSRIVNCGTHGASIQRAIDRFVLSRPITILVRGDCVENVDITRDDVTLVAHWQGGSVDGTINVVGAQRVTIDGLTVTGEGEGVSVRDNASATIRNATLENNTGSGVFAGRNALVILRDNVITANGEYGVLVTDGANAQIRGGNTIESDVADWLNVGAAIGGYRHATIRIRDGGNVIRNNAMSEVMSPGNFPPPPPPPGLPPGIPPGPLPEPIPVPPASTDALGFAIDVEHNSSFRQDRGHATIVGHIEIFNLTSADFRDTDLTGHIFVDGMNANVRLRNSSVDGGMTMFGEANLRDTVQFTGDIYCNTNFLNPNVVPSPPGRRLQCAPEIHSLPPFPAP